MKHSRRARTAPRQWTDDQYRPRVLVEERDGAVQWAMANILRRAGYEVECCGGPEERPCPLLEGGRCPLAEGADVVWNALGYTGGGLEVLERFVASTPGTPVVLELPDPSMPRSDTTVDESGVLRVRYPVAAHEVVPAVETLLRMDTAARR